MENIFVLLVFSRGIHQLNADYPNKGPLIYGVLMFSSFLSCANCSTIFRTVSSLRQLLISTYFDPPVAGLTLKYNETNNVGDLTHKNVSNNTLNFVGSQWFLCRLCSNTPGLHKNVHTIRMNIVFVKQILMLSSSESTRNIFHSFPLLHPTSPAGARNWICLYGQALLNTHSRKN